MKFLFVSAFLFFSAFAQTPVASVPATEQKYLSSLPVLKKGYRIPDHLKGKSLLNSSKWPSLQVTQEFKPIHQEASATTKKSAQLLKKPQTHKLVEIKVPKVSKEYAGQLTIEKTNSNSKSQQPVEIPVDVHARQNNVHNHSEESQKDHQKNKGQLKKEQVHRKKNLRSEEKSEQVQSVRQESEHTTGLIVPLPFPVVIDKPAQVVAEPLPLRAPEVAPAPAELDLSIKPAEIVSEALPATAELDPSIQPAEAMAVSSSEEDVSSTSFRGAIQVDDVLETQGHQSDEIYGTQYPTLGEIKVPAQVYAKPWWLVQGKK